MSNRIEDQISAQAELRLSHLAQIEALTVPGLTSQERVERFAAAASFSIQELWWSLDGLERRGAAKNVWFRGRAAKSLFANLPGCDCPVLEELPGVPRSIPNHWNPSAHDLETFSRIQIERRFP